MYSFHFHKIVLLVRFVLLISMAILAISCKSNHNFSRQKYTNFKGFKGHKESIKPIEELKKESIEITLKNQVTHERDTFNYTPSEFDSVAQSKVDTPSTLHINFDTDASRVPILNMDTKSVQSTEKKPVSNRSRAYPETIKHDNDGIILIIAVLGALIMIASVVVGIIYFASIGWLSVLLAAGGILFGVLICYLGAALIYNGSGSDIGVGLIMILGLSISVPAWLIWIIVQLIRRV